MKRGKWIEQSINVPTLILGFPNYNDCDSKADSTFPLANTFNILLKSTCHVPCIFGVRGGGAILTTDLTAR